MHERRGDLPRRVVGGERQWPAVLERCAVAGRVVAGRVVDRGVVVELLLGEGLCVGGLVAGAVGQRVLVDAHEMGSRTARLRRRT